VKRPTFIYVTTDPVNHVGWVSGYGARELIEECGGRPLWSRTRKAWNTSEATAIDVIAAAGHRGFAISYERLDRDRQ
jgi:hypothetical protein